MGSFVLQCGAMFDGVSDRLTGPVEILVEGDRIAEIGAAVAKPTRAQIVDLSARTVSPGFIDTHVHLTMDATRLPQQTLESSATKALKGLSIAREWAARIPNSRPSIYATHLPRGSSRHRG